MAIGKVENAGVLFAGQGDLIIFDAVADYGKEDLGLSDLANPKSLGQIVQDSTSWEGEDPEISEILDEQGNVITARTAAGTLGFSFDIASTSQEMIKLFLGGKSVAWDSNETWGTGTAMIFGTEIPTIVRPIAIVNDLKNRTWLYPKAKITSSLSLEDGLYRIHCTVIAEGLDAKGLGTVMVLDAQLTE
ncbi:MAG: hypothetical protein J6Q35_05345 [Rikenellaceae bacterium]|nr:hypothetical protein [Rikenellaceae bacterium]